MVSSPEKLQEKEEKKRPPLPDALPEEIKKTLENWGKILKKLPSGQTAAVACLKSADLTIEEDVLIIAFDNIFDNRISKQEDQEVLSQIMDEVTGKHVKFKVVVKNDPAKFDETHPDLSDIIDLRGVEEGIIEDGQEGSDELF